MKRSLPLVALGLGTLCAGAFAQPIDTPPTTPVDPTARAYGPTSGGVAWQRSTDDRRVVGYEITRDGTVLGVRDTLSYVADDLEPGRGYNFAIVAIDSAGQRSGRALARIETPDARPNTPTGLSATVYSRTAAGITWNRSGVFGERYEVKRDGEIVAAATNGTSYIDTTLSARRPYLFEVIAVNRQGQRSPAARLFVRTAEGSTPPPAATGPAAPGGLRSVVYSATAGAVAWERVSSASLRYEVSRDGQVVATTNGTSYVDDVLLGGQSYAYSVVAIDRQGGRSAASTVSLVTPQAESPDPEPPADSTIIAVENRAEVLANVLDVISGEVYRAAFALVDDVLFGEEGKTLVSREPNLDAGFDSVSDCEGGGRFENTSSGTSQSVNDDIAVDGCRIDGIVFDGTVQSGGFRGSEELSTNLTITRATGETVSLASERRHDNLTLLESRQLSVTSYEATSSDGPVSIENASSAVANDRDVDSAPTQNAMFAAQVSAPWTGGETLEIRTKEPFVIALPPGIDSDQTTYTSGILVAEASDGSRLVLDAGNGDPGSLTLTIEADGATSAFTVSVQEEAQIPCIAPPQQRGDLDLACGLDLGSRFR